MVYMPTKTNMSPWGIPPWALRAGGAAAGAGLMSYNRYYKGPSGGRGGVARGAVQTTVTGRSMKRKRTSFKSKVINVGPAKHLNWNTLNALTHDAMLTNCPTSGIVQGTAIGNRIGDQVELLALKLKGYFQTTNVSGAFQYRIIVGYSGEEYAGLASTFGTGLTTAQVFLPLTPQWTANGIVNPKAFTTLYDQTVDINSLVATTPDLMGVSVTIPLNKTFPYQESASVFGKDKNLYVLIVGEINGGVAGTTATGTASFSFDLIYK